MFETVSKRHAEIEAESPDKAIFIKDLKSSNKTALNLKKLKPFCCYQLNNGDDLAFGRVKAKFQIFSVAEDVSNTSEGHKGIETDVIPTESIINDFDDESDESIIQGTQTSESKTHSRLSKIQCNQKVDTEDSMIPPFTFEDIPSPLSKSTNKIICSDGSTEAIDLIVITSEGQKVATAEKIQNDIFEMETQRPAQSEYVSISDAKDQNISICDDQPIGFNNKTTDIHTVRKLNIDESICSANTQKVSGENEEYTGNESNTSNILIHSVATQNLEDPNKKGHISVLVDDSIENLETQQFKTNGSTESKKIVSEKLIDESMEEVETQELFDKSLQTSISRIYSNETKLSSRFSKSLLQNSSVEDLETQNYHGTSHTIPNNSKSREIINPKAGDKLVNESINEMETQELFNKSPQTSISKSYNSETKSSSRFSKSLLKVSSVEDLETQNYHKKSLSFHNNLKSPEINKLKGDELLDESINQIETQQLNAASFSRSQIIGISNLKLKSSFKVNKCESSISKIPSNKSASSIFSESVLNNLFETIDNQEMNDLNPQDFNKELLKKSSTPHPKTKKLLNKSASLHKNCDESSNDIEIQKIDHVKVQFKNMSTCSEKSTDRKVKLKDFSYQSINDAETQEFERDLSNDNEISHLNLSKTRKSMNKYLHKTSDSEDKKKELDLSIDNIETQQLENYKAVDEKIYKNLRKSKQGNSLREAETQKNKPKKLSLSQTAVIDKTVENHSEALKSVSDQLHSKSIEDSEIQHISNDLNVNKSQVASLNTKEAPELLIHNEVNESFQQNQVQESNAGRLNCLQTPKKLNEKSVAEENVEIENRHESKEAESSFKLNNECMDEIETQKFDNSEAKLTGLNKLRRSSMVNNKTRKSFVTESDNKTLNDLKTDECRLTLDSSRKSRLSVKSPTIDSLEEVSEPLDELETQQISTSNERMDDIETQKYDTSEPKTSVLHKSRRSSMLHDKARRSAVKEFQNKTFDKLETEECHTHTLDGSRKSRLSEKSPSTDSLEKEVSEPLDELETQQITTSNKRMDGIETQKYDTSEAKSSVLHKSRRSSMFNDNARRSVVEESHNKTLDELETEECHTQTFDCSRKPRSSVKSPLTDLIEKEAIEPLDELETQQISTNNERMDDIETQKYDNSEAKTSVLQKSRRSSMINNKDRKSIVQESNKTLDASETEECHTHTLDCSRKSRLSIKLPSTDSLKEKVNEPFDKLETQQITVSNECMDDIETQKLDTSEAKSSVLHKSRRPSIRNEKARKSDVQESHNKTLNELETEDYHTETFDCSKKLRLNVKLPSTDSLREKVNEPFDELETQQVTTSNNCLDDIETQRFDSSIGRTPVLRKSRRSSLLNETTRKSVVKESYKKTFDVLETEECHAQTLTHSRKSRSCVKPSSIDISKEKVDKTIDELETQQITTRRSLRLSSSKVQRNSNRFTRESLNEKHKLLTISQCDESLNDAETQKVESSIPEESGVISSPFKTLADSVDDLDTQDFKNIKSSNYSRLSSSLQKHSYDVSKNNIDGSVNETETQEVKTRSNDFNSQKEIQKQFMCSNVIETPSQQSIDELSCKINRSTTISSPESETESENVDNFELHPFTTRKSRQGRISGREDHKSMHTSETHLEDLETDPSQMNNDTSSTRSLRRLTVEPVDEAETKEFDLTNPELIGTRKSIESLAVNKNSSISTTAKVNDESRRNISLGSSISLALDASNNQKNATNTDDEDLFQQSSEEDIFASTDSLQKSCTKHSKNPTCDKADNSIKSFTKSFEKNQSSSDKYKNTARNILSSSESDENIFDDNYEEKSNFSRLSNSNNISLNAVLDKKSLPSKSAKATKISELNFKDSEDDIFSIQDDESKISQIDKQKDNICMDEPGLRKKSFESNDLKRGRDNSSFSNENKRIKLDDKLNCTIERNLEKMFEGNANEVLEPEQSILQTQQLENILEASQVKEASTIESPTLSKKRSSVKFRRQSNRLFNDTIEKNLNDLFEDNVDDSNSYQPESMMTQQLENVLFSQEDESLTNDDQSRRTTVNDITTPSTLKGIKRFSRLSLKKLDDEKECNSLKKNLNESGNENHVTYRRGTVGFDFDLKSVSTPDRVAISNIGRSFTSDSQSENEDACQNVSPTIGRKRFKLSLSKKVNLNASMSSTKSEPGTPTANHKTTKSLILQSSTKRASSSQGSNINLKAVTNMSADSTESETDHVITKASTFRASEHELKTKERKSLLVETTLKTKQGNEETKIQSVRSCDDLLTRKKESQVCNSNNINISHLGGPQSSFQREEDSNASDLDDFFDNMPNITIAGTVDCPATNSQLAAPSDDDDLESVKSIDIPGKWKLYAEKRYDILYKSEEILKKTEDIKQSLSRSSFEKIDASKRITEILNNLDSSKANEKQFESNKNTPKSSRSLRSKKLNNDSPNSPFRHGGLTVKKDLSESFNIDSDSDNLDDLFPKFKLPPRFKCIPGETNLDDVEDSDDEQFNLLRRRCREMLAKRKTKSFTATNSVENTSSPLLSRNSRRKKCSLDENLVFKGPCSKKGEGLETFDGTLKTDEDAFFQIVPRKSNLPATMMSRRKSNDQKSRQSINKEKIKQSSSSNEVQKLSVMITPLKEKFISNKNIRQMVNCAIFDEIIASEKQKQKKIESKEKPSISTIRITRRDYGTGSPVAEVSKETNSRTKTSNKRTMPDENSSKENMKNNKMQDAEIRKTRSKRNVKATETSQCKDSQQSSCPAKQSKTACKDYLDVESDSSDEFEELRLVKNSQVVNTEKWTVPDKHKKQALKKANMCSMSSIANDQLKQLNCLVNDKSQTNDTLEVKAEKSQDDKILVNTDQSQGSVLSALRSSRRNKTKNDLIVEKTDKSEHLSNNDQSKKQLKNKINSNQSDELVELNSKVLNNVKINNDKASRNSVEKTDLKQTQEKNSISSKTRSSKKDNLSKNANEVTTSRNQTKQNRKVKDNQSSKSETNSDNTIWLEKSQSSGFRSTRNRGKKINYSEELKEEDKNESKEVNTRTRVTRARKDTLDNGSTLTKELLLIEKPNTSVTTRGKDSVQSKSAPALERPTRNKRNKNVETIKSNEELSELVHKKKDRGSKRKANKADADSQVLQDLEPAERSLRSQRGKKRISTERKTSESVDSSESKKNTTNKSSVRNKKQADLLLSDANYTPSAESQEVCEIMKGCEVKDPSKIKTRNVRISTRNKTAQSDLCEDDANEKPTNRPKRTRKETLLQTNPQDSQKGDISYNKNISSRAKRRRINSCLSASSDESSTVDFKNESSPKVYFIGKRSESLWKAVKNLGGTVVENISDCSIVVADKVQKSFEFLQAVSQSTPILSFGWLNSCKKANRFVQWKDYILKDLEAETKYQFKLTASLEKAKINKLLDGYTVLLAPGFKESFVSELRELVTINGGKSLVRAPTKWSKDTIVISDKEYLESAKKFISKAPKTVTIHSTEFIMIGLLRQELNLQEFKLSV